MARISDAELERLKAEISVERLVEAAGVELTKNGKDRLGKCPFHEDREASLVVTPEKNLFHCFGCGAAGGPIDWVIKTRGVSFRHAVELLRSDLSLVAGPVDPVKTSPIRRLPSLSQNPLSGQICHLEAHPKIDKYHAVRNFSMMYHSL